MHRISHNQQPPTREVAEQNFLERVFVRKGKGGRACVVVLGDLGRSPRMQYQALSLSRQSRIEKHFGKMADGSFCVTKAMQHELAENWDIKATVFPHCFTPRKMRKMRLHNDIIPSLMVFKVVLAMVREW
ncbi:UDP-glycosyltransferase TURAN-like isoform X3 [Cucurbita maxima]|uniref:UDP-glycosyltransferase TURAN-like isoform X3 n=1 Tax=Cucurbita maxima TaxID=3661 RepID=A0A6J1J6H4_CUCMA|nr:UDP-glycosyltransferase TURAN-like isoform X3 [Cucurbita maxima]